MEHIRKLRMPTLFKVRLPGALYSSTMASPGRIPAKTVSYNPILRVSSKSLELILKPILFKVSDLSILLSDGRSLPDNDRGRENKINRKNVFIYQTSYNKC